MENMEDLFIGKIKLEEVNALGVYELKTGEKLEQFTVNGELSDGKGHSVDFTSVVNKWTTEEIVEWECVNHVLLLGKFDQYNLQDTDLRYFAPAIAKETKTFKEKEGK